MRIVLADLKGGEGFTSKDTVAGGYGSRLRPFPKVTEVVSQIRRRFHDLSSVHLGYAAALAKSAGHHVTYSEGELADGDVAIVLSSLVDYRRAAMWADAMRARGARVGFTFTHPFLTPTQLQFLLGAAYTRFYMRPSFLANFLRIRAPQMRRLVTALDARVGRHHVRREHAQQEEGR